MFLKNSFEFHVTYDAEKKEFNILDLSVPEEEPTDLLFKGVETVAVLDQAFKAWVEVITER